MDEKQARKLITKLVNAAYEAGMHSVNPESLYVKFWKGKAESMVEELVHHLTSRSSRAADSCPKCGKPLIMGVCETGCGYIPPPA